MQGGTRLRWGPGDRLRLLSKLRVCCPIKPLINFHTFIKAKVNFTKIVENTSKMKNQNKMFMVKGTCKVRNEIETKRNRMKRNEIKQNETKPNETKRSGSKRNETKCNETKRNVTKKKKRNEIKQNETKSNETKRNRSKRNETKCNEKK